MKVNEDKKWRYRRCVDLVEALMLGFVGFGASGTDAVKWFSGDELVSVPRGEITVLALKHGIERVFFLSDNYFSKYSSNSFSCYVYL